MTQLWIATNNKDKFKEIRELLKEIKVEVHGAFELPAYTSPRESGMTFKENARIKAFSLKAMKPDAWILADDSGLEVQVLDGLPGVHSARYAGPTARDVENTAKLLKQIVLRSSGDNRAARFICVLCLISPTGEELYFEGELKGSISKDMRGKTGFGYDCVFVPEGETKTIAELGLAVKNRLSHRAQALKKAREHLKTISQ